MHQQTLFLVMQYMVKNEHNQNNFEHNAIKCEHNAVFWGKFGMQLKWSIIYSSLYIHGSSTLYSYIL